MAKYQDIINQAGQRWDVDPALVNAVFQVESSGDPSAINKDGGGKGAYGGMQVRQAALADYNKANGTSFKMEDLLKPDTGIDVGTWYLGQQLDRFGDVGKALVAYNKGPNSRDVDAGSSPYSQKVVGMISGAPAQAQTMPGIPASPTGNVDEIFAAFTKSGAPTAQTDADDQVFNAFLKEAPASPASSGSPARAEVKASPLEGFIKGVGQGLTDIPVGAAQLALTGQQNFLNRTPIGMLGRLMGLGGGVDSDKAAVDAYAKKREEAYQAATPGSVSAGVGRVVGGLPYGLGAGRAINAASDVGAQILARSPGLGRLLGASTGGAATGAGFGALTPDATGAGKASQIGLGAMVGGALPGVAAAGKGAGRYVGDVARSVVDPFTKAGQERIAANVLQRAANGGQLAGSSSEIIPGSVPTLAEVTGNPGIAKLQRTVRDINPAPFVEREQANAGARQTIVDRLLPNDQAAEGAKSAYERSLTSFGQQAAVPAQAAELQTVMNRPIMQSVLKDAEKAVSERGGANPFQQARQASSDASARALSTIQGTKDDLESAIANRRAASNSLYAKADGEVFPVDEELSKLLQRPSMSTAISRAERLAKEEGQPVSSLLTRDEDGNISSFTGKYLNLVKMSLDDRIDSGIVSGGIGSHERAALTGTKNSLLDWMDSQSPTYAAARQAYADLSKPVEQFQHLQGLQLLNSDGSVNATKLHTAIQSIEKARAKKGAFGGAADVGDDALNALKSLRSNLGRQPSIPEGVSQNGMAAIQEQIAKRLTNPSKLTPDEVTSLQNARKLLQSTESPSEALLSSAPKDFAGPLRAQDVPGLAKRNMDGINAIRDLNLLNTKDDVTLASVTKAIRKLEDSNQPVRPSQIKALNALRDDLMRASNTELGRSAGSSTAQNLATQNMMSQILPGRTGAFVGSLPPGSVGTGVGTGLGFLAGGPVGAAAGGVIGGGLGRGLSGAMNGQNQAIQGALTRMLLDASAGGAALQGAPGLRAPVTQVGGLQRLLYPSAATGSNNGNSRSGR
jgi:hypothetical protein